MADIYTSKDDENTIQDVLSYGLQTPDEPKYTVLRLALAKSLRLDTPPDSEFDRVSEKKSEYALKQITGKGRPNDDEGICDFDEITRMLLSVYHHEDLFQDDKAYRTYLQRHIRRGLYEIRTTWTRSHDFLAFLQEELFAGFNPQKTEQQPEIPAEQLYQALLEIGVKADIRNTQYGPRLSRSYIYLDNISHYDTLKRGLSKLALTLGIQEGVFLQNTSEPKIVGLDIPRKPEAWQQVTTAGLTEWAEQQTAGKNMPVWLGLDALGQNFGFDLEEAPHLMLAGSTGSGKSICLHALLISLLQTQTPETLQLALIDSKQVELSRYETLPNLFSEGVVQSVLKVGDLLNDLIAEMERRNKLLRELGVSSLKEALKTHKNHLPRIVLVIEELADLFMQSKELENLLVQLAQKSRSAGIHIVLATQRPDAATFSGLLRSNIPGRIALRVQKTTESKIILDENGAEKLLGKGDMLVKTPPYPQPMRVHGAYVTQDDIQAAIRHFVRG